MSHPAHVPMWRIAAIALMSSIVFMSFITFISRIVSIWRGEI